MGKTADYGTRLIISAPNLKVESLDDLMVDVEYCALPLASAIVNFYPFIIFNVKRFFDSLIMSGKDFVKKYSADIRKANSLKDFTFKMYKYNNDKINKTPGEVDVDAKFNDIMGALSPILMIKDDGTVAGVSTEVEAVKKEFSDEEICKKMSKELGYKSCDNTSDFRTEAFASFRNGAEDQTDKEEIDVTDLSEYAKYLEDSTTVGKIDTYTRKIDSAYKKVIKFIDDAASKLGKEKPTGTTSFTRDNEKDVINNGPKVMSMLS